MPTGLGHTTHFDRAHDNALPIPSLETTGNFSNGNTTPHRLSITRRGREYKAFVPSMFLITLAHVGAASATGKRHNTPGQSFTMGLRTLSNSGTLGPGGNNERAEAVPFSIALASAEREGGRTAR